MIWNPSANGSAMIHLIFIEGLAMIGAFLEFNRDTHIFQVRIPKLKI